MNEIDTRYYKNPNETIEQYNARVSGFQTPTTTETTKDTITDTTPKVDTTQSDLQEYSRLEANKQKAESLIDTTLETPDLETIQEKKRKEVQSQIDQINTELGKTEQDITGQVEQNKRALAYTNWLSGSVGSQDVLQKREPIEQKGQQQKDYARSLATSKINQLYATADSLAESEYEEAIKSSQEEAKAYVTQVETKAKETIKGFASSLSEAGKTLEDFKENSPDIYAKLKKISGMNDYELESYYNQSIPEAYRPVTKTNYVDNGNGTTKMIVSTWNPISKKMDTKEYAVNAPISTFQSDEKPIEVGNMLLVKQADGSYKNVAPMVLKEGEQMVSPTGQSQTTMSGVANKIVSSLSDDEINTIIATMAENEKGVGLKLNNPLNMKYSTTTEALGAVDSGVKATDGGTFAEFSTPEQGLQASKELLKSDIYSGLTVDQALKKWSNNGYGAEILGGGVSIDKYSQDILTARLGKQIYGTRISDAEGKRIQSLISQGINQGKSELDIIDDVLGYKITKNKEVGDSIKTLLLQNAGEAGLAGFDMLGVARLLNEDKVSEAITKAELMVYNNAKKSDSDGFISESKVKTAIAKADDLQSKFDELNKLGNNPTGVATGTMEKWLNKLQSAEATEIRSKIVQLTAKMQHELLGSAVTETEKKFLAPLIPDINDTPENFLIKLNQLKETPILELNNFRTTYGLPELDYNSLIDKNNRKELYGYSESQNEYKAGDVIIYDGKAYMIGDDGDTLIPQMSIQ